MLSGTPDPDRYTFERVIAFVQAVEGVYDVSLKYCLRLRGGPDGPARVFVQLFGSGDLFDQMPGAGGGAECEVYHDQPGGLGEALYLATLTLVQRFDKLKGTHSARPAL